MEYGKVGIRWKILDENAFVVSKRGPKKGHQTPIITPFLDNIWVSSERELPKYAFMFLYAMVLTNTDGECEIYLN